MTESEARELAREINQRDGWFARAGEQPFINSDNHEWWVWAHHDSMRPSTTMPYPELPITSRQEWEEARAKWRNQPQA